MMILQNWVPSIWGEYRWAILSAFPKPMPVRHSAAVFPKFFTTNKTLDLPYMPYDPTRAPLGETRSLPERGSLCFQTTENGDYIPLSRRALGWFYDQRKWAKMTIKKNNKHTEFSQPFWQSAIWLNGTFLPPNFSDGEYPHQPKVSPLCSVEDEGGILPWSECQSRITRWADANKTFSFSPNMILDPKANTVMREGPFLQGHSMNPFHKWLLCGINGSCTTLNSLVFLQGGAAGRTYFTGIINGTMVKQEGDRAPQVTDATQLITGVNKTLIKHTDFLPTPVCVYPPFLFILLNNSFIDCSNETCEMSLCWDARWASRAMVTRVPRWIPVPVETPSTLSLFRQKRDFGITAAIVTAISLAAAAATAAGVAMASSVQTSTALNQISATVTEAMNTHASATAQLKGGRMVVNQRLDLVEERLDILFQLAQLGCERNLGALCITSVQYQNFTRAANLSRKLSLYLTGNWSEGFEKTMELLRAAIVTINATRIDLSMTEGLYSWISSAFSFFKEWVGVGLFGAALCCGLVFMLWLVCKLKAQQKRDKALITQVLMAMEQGASPAVWLSMLRKN
ncbi:uncharacterized protein LOC143435478 [Arvicanthis niloticus]|uniref:uncharacterized protein LOC143309872 n=1 Tax=Arvicanthis niloticus TaxID=61156 RepID=UPI00402B0B84